MPGALEHGQSIGDKIYVSLATSSALARPSSTRIILVPTHPPGGGHAGGGGSTAATQSSSSSSSSKVSHGGHAVPAAARLTVTARYVGMVALLCTCLVLLFLSALRPLDHAWQPLQTWASFKSATELRLMFIGDAGGAGDLDGSGVDARRIAGDAASVRVPGVVVPASFVATLPANGTAATAAPQHHLFTVLADMFLVGECVHVVSATECDFELDFSEVELEVHGVYPAGACNDTACVASEEERAGGRGWTRPRGPLQRLKVRTLWEWAVVGEVCHPSLGETTATATADVEVHYRGASMRTLLTRGPTNKGADFAMMLLFRGDLFLTPLWMEYWVTVGGPVLCVCERACVGWAMGACMSACQSQAHTCGRASAALVHPLARAPWAFLPTPPPPATTDGGAALLPVLQRPHRGNA